MDLASNTCLRIKPLEELTLMDDYMFAAVMRNKANLKPLLEYILKMKITSVKTSEERRHEYMVMMIREMEIREEGREEGVDTARLESIENIMEGLKYTAQQAMDLLKIPAADQPKYVAKL